MRVLAAVLGSKSVVGCIYRLLTRTRSTPSGSRANRKSMGWKDIRQGPEYLPTIRQQFDESRICRTLATFRTSFTGFKLAGLNRHGEQGLCQPLHSSTTTGTS